MEIITMKNAIVVGLLVTCGGLSIGVGTTYHMIREQSNQIDALTTKHNDMVQVLRAYSETDQKLLEYTNKAHDRITDLVDKVKIVDSTAARYNVQLTHRIDRLHGQEGN
jgi:hypothetical protein